MSGEFLRIVAETYGWIRIKICSNLTERPNSFFKLFQQDDPKQTHNVREIIEDHHGTIWAGASHGLLKVSSNDSTFQFILPVPASQSSFNKNIKHIIEEEDGTFLMATRGGLLKWNPESKETEENFLPKAFKRYPVDHLSKDRTGNFWITFLNKGLGIFDIKSEQFYYYTHNPNQLNSLSDDEVSCVLEDRFRNIWVCTKSGICKIQIDNSGFKLSQNHVGFDHIYQPM